MFNTTYIDKRPVAQHSSSSVSITEKRAPTDESVRLLREMEETALNNVLKVLDIQDNIVSGRLIIFHSIESFNKRYKCLFKINEKDFSIDGELPYNVEGTDGEYIQKFYDVISKQLAKFLLENSMEELPKIF